MGLFIGRSEEIQTVYCNLFGPSIPERLGDFNLSFIRELLAEPIIEIADLISSVLASKG
ncbi:hypothetical protein D3C76_1416840 [compost metagenome]